MAIFKGVPQLFPCFFHIILVHVEATFKISVSDTPAHGKHLWDKDFIGKLSLDPFNEDLAVLEIVTLKLNLNESQREEEHTVLSVVRSFVLFVLLHDSEKCL